MNDILDLVWMVVPTTRRTSKQGRCDILAPLPSSRRGDYTVALYVEREIAEHIVALHNKAIKDGKHGTENNSSD